MAGKARKPRTADPPERVKLSTMIPLESKKHLELYCTEHRCSEQDAVARAIELMAGHLHIVRRLSAGGPPPVIEPDVAPVALHVAG